MGKMKTRKFSPEIKKAIIAYYNGRTAAKTGGPWDKQSCLNNISNVVLKEDSGIGSFAASAGTFFFTWEDGVTTIHSEKYWWRMMKYSTWQKHIRNR
jgi:hypothetical protein